MSQFCSLGHLVDQSGVFKMDCHPHPEPHDAPLSPPEKRSANLHQPGRTGTWLSFHAVQLLFLYRYATLTRLSPFGMTGHHHFIILGLRSICPVLEQKVL